MGWLPWTYALALAIPLTLVGVLWRPTGHRRTAALAFAREVALVLGLYALWNFAGRLSLMRIDGAIERGRSIARFQDALGMPSEVGVQGLFIGHDVAIRALNVYYAWLHVPTMVVFLVWLFVRHRDRYPAWRTSLALLTAACFVIQLVPVAPPRMFGDLGFVDTGYVFGQSVYGPPGHPGPAELSAMPSLHVGWAVLIGWAVVAVSANPWRLCALAHPLLTVLVVTATANHWWLDGVVAACILVAIRAGAPAARRLGGAVRGQPVPWIPGQPARATLGAHGVPIERVKDDGRGRDR